VIVNAKTTRCDVMRANNIVIPSSTDKTKNYTVAHPSLARRLSCTVSSVEQRYNMATFYLDGSAN